MDDTDVSRIKALCKEFLGEQWTKNEVCVSKLTGGFGNRTFRCSLRNKASEDVLVRLYGSKYSGNNNLHFKFNSEAVEAVIVHILAKIGFAPKLLGVFNGGRIEQFIEGKNPLVSDYSDKNIASAIARKLAKYHSFSMPITKQIQYPGKIKLYAMGLTPQTSLNEFDVKEHDYVEKILNFPLVTEFEWYEKTAPIFGSRIVFSHNDFHVHNMIIKDTSESFDDRLIFVDYETSGYNYRSFDIGHYTLTMRFRFGENIGTHYFVDFDPKSDFVAEKFFISEYLEEWRKFDMFDEFIDNVDRILMEAIFFNTPTFLNMITLAKKSINDHSKDMNSYAFLSSAVDQYYRIKDHVSNQYLTNLCEIK